eukprot:COSAG02_NODE_3174_length_7227_cov_30.253227_3_plen_131_part_00
MRVIEDMSKAIMADTRLNIEDYPLAVDHAVWTLNLVPMSKKLSRDGTGPRPLQELSRWNVSVKECDARLASSQTPGTLCYVRMRDPPRGSNVGQLNKYRWGRVVRTEGRTVIFQDPWKLHVEFETINQSH